MTHAHCTRRRRRSRGQAMAELALILPVIAILFIGVATTATFLSDGQVAGQAVRAGARLAAEDGNGNYGTGTTGCQLTGLGAKDPCIIDDQVIQTVLTTAGNLYDATLNEIDIYEPSGGGGVGNPGCTTFSAGTCPPNNGAYSSTFNEPINIYSVSGTTVTAPTTYPLSCSPTPIDCYTLGLRNQTPPDEAELGVRIVFAYTSPTLRMFTWTADTQYTVVRLSP